MTNNNKPEQTAANHRLQTEIELFDRQVDDAAADLIIMGSHHPRDARRYATEIVMRSRRLASKNRGRLPHRRMTAEQRIRPGTWVLFAITVGLGVVGLVHLMNLLTAFLAGGGGR